MYIDESIRLKPIQAYLSFISIMSLNNNDLHLVEQVSKSAGTQHAYIQCMHSIVIKRKPNMSCHLLNVFTKFQIDISKNVEKSPENSVGWTVRWMDIVSAWYHYFSNSNVKWSQTCETGGALRTYIFPPRSNSEAYGPLGNDSSPRLFRPHPYSRPVLLNANMCSSPQATYSTATLNLRQQNSRVTGRNDLIISYF